MKTTAYTAGFREQPLEKVLSRGYQTIEMITEQLNMSHYTLKNGLLK